MFVNQTQVRRPYSAAMSYIYHWDLSLSGHLDELFIIECAQDWSVLNVIFLKVPVHNSPCAFSCIFHFQLIDLDLWNAFCEVLPWGSFLFTTLHRKQKVCNPGDEAMMKIHNSFIGIPIDFTFSIISPNLGCNPFSLSKTRVKHIWKQKLPTNASKDDLVKNLPKTATVNPPLYIIGFNTTISETNVIIIAVYTHIADINKLSY